MSIRTRNTQTHGHLLVPVIFLQKPFNENKYQSIEYQSLISKLMMLHFV